MIDIGEDLVGAYLREVRGCSIVQHNVRTGFGQGEIDVVGIDLRGSAVERLWLCEVSTHTRGLGGYGGDAAGKMRTKVATVKRFADQAYPGIARTIEIWSPKVTRAMEAKVRSGLDADPDVRLIANGDYAERVLELARTARASTAYSNSPAFRLLQILSVLPGDLLTRRPASSSPEAHG